MNFSDYLDARMKGETPDVERGMMPDCQFSRTIPREVTVEKIREIADEYAGKRGYTPCKSRYLTRSSDGHGGKGVVELNFHFSDSTHVHGSARHERS
ncbi:MAG: hypothetical protein OXR66_06870 [Candidatus Woesearchaeota archaeon]|nr:hypothetical protein [Candidatus Woesearchaeota archaeon]